MIVWIIGWLFTVGWAGQDYYKQKTSGGEIIGYCIFVAFLFFAIWPICLGSEVFKVLKK